MDYDKLKALIRQLAREYIEQTGGNIPDALRLLEKRIRPEREAATQTKCPDINMILISDAAVAAVDYLVDTEIFAAAQERKERESSENDLPRAVPRELAHDCIHKTSGNIAEAERLMLSRIDEMGLVVRAIGDAYRIRFCGWLSNYEVAPLISAAISAAARSYELGDYD
jgi:hypothetical protein